ncbi:MAG TPA: hypothetical protein VJ913_05870 [Actinomycetota bacterium]|nr:hypothetical protein [Actinomycetota bacterium]
MRRPPTGSVEPDGPDVSSLIRAAALLRESRMPAEEIRTIVTSAEPELVHRYLELHLERLEEWLLEQRRTLASVEDLLATGTRSADRRAAS